MNFTKEQIETLLKTKAVAAISEVTRAAKAKGESYTVVDASKKKVIKVDMTRQAANKLEKTNPNYISGSAAFMHDKFISKW